MISKLFLGVFLSIILVVFLFFYRQKTIQEISLDLGTDFDSTVKDLVENFDEDFTVEETSKNNIDRNKIFWVSSGAYFISENGIAKTIQGELEKENKWRKLYDKNNSRDTDNGFHPQNIFRLVNLGLWTNYRQESYFKIVKDNKSGSEYRNDSNGLLFFNRYLDSNNLYYTGVRVDGFAVIKKKVKGKYFTLAYNQIYPGKYDREKNSNLLPHGQWIGLRSEVTNGENGSVNIKLYLDREKNGNWELIAEAVDDGKQYGGKAMTEAGHGGIRTDFMDVQFDDYKIEELK